MAETVHRAGLVALLGRPNAGKSTLLNHLLGEKLAIVTAKPQTTRSRILGILTLENAQLLLLDTPGRHESSKRLNRALGELVEEATADCDVALLLVDPSARWSGDDATLLERLAARSTPVILVGTKGDLPGSRSAAWPPPGADSAALPLQVSARTGQGIPQLLEEIVARLPESPRLYPGDQLSDRPLRFLAAELVREAAFEELSQELPYALAVEIVDFDESRSDLVRIRARLLVERESQKPIVIGSGGSMVKRIGIRARREIERLLATQVHLELRVKVEAQWSHRPNRLKTLGYT